MRLSSTSKKQTIASLQAFFYLATGVWPLVHIASFVAVTGAESKPPQSLWLVKTVALLICVVGVVVGIAAIRRRITPEIVLLATLSAAALAAIDLIYVPLKVIAPIYLADAAAEIVLILLWIWACVGNSGES
ncbi:MAG TPA: hypothetical protein VF681_12405 [Abditibacteriaceae bacterium]|jgi:hypothetical protein